jgi:diguanylate cyclase (GGDEF)-like protein
MAEFLSYFKQTDWGYVHRDQLASLARTTPAAMIGYGVNILVVMAAFRGVVPDAALLTWGISALALCAWVGFRSLRRRPVKAISQAQSPMRSARSAWVLGLLLGLPWSVLAVGGLGAVTTDLEGILLALIVGMAASGSVLLAPVPAAAVIYATVLVVPLVVKCFLLGGSHYVVLGALGVSFFVFLIGLIVANARLFRERLVAVDKLKETVAALSDAREETERVAMTDGLTGVANRRAFMARVNGVSNLTRRMGEFGIFYIDLDRFKAVNDTLGHAVGDALLKIAASRIGKSVRAGDLVARLGGDEFAIVAHDIVARGPARMLAERLVATLSEPYHLDGQKIEIGASVGVALTAESHAEGDLLLKQADLAMYAAKGAGRCGYSIFEPDMQRSADERSAVEVGLKSALMRGEFELYYQPIRRLSTAAITGFECLIRWRHPTRGLLLPGQFLNIADDMGISDEIGAWVIKEACEQALKWPLDLSIAINLSPLHIASGDISGRVERVLAATGFPAGRLELEITETSLLQSDPETIDALRQLKSMGVSISLDDFGTGFSSLSYLVSFPFNRIKIDRLFTSQLGHSKQSELIVRAVAQLAKNLNCTVVAEGIETIEQVERLRALHVSHGQGFLLGRPISAVETAKLLAAVAADAAEGAASRPFAKSA